MKATVRSKDKYSDIDPKALPNMVKWAIQEGYVDVDNGPPAVDSWSIADLLHFVVQPALEEAGVPWQESRQVALDNDFGSVDELNDWVLDVWSQG